MREGGVAATRANCLCVHLGPGFFFPLSHEMQTLVSLFVMVTAAQPGDTCVGSSNGFVLLKFAFSALCVLADGAA